MTSNIRAVLQQIGEWFPDLTALPTGVYAVGGVVRDALLGIEPLDADLTARSVDGIARGFASHHETHVVELGRDPMKVQRVVVSGRIYDFVEMTGSSIEGDLLRRDFTMNALAVEIGAHRLIDPLEGASDIEQRLVRMVSEQNLRDDPLRIVKAVRMAVKFGFDIEHETLDAMRRNAARVSDVAVERVTYELRAILEGPNPARGADLLSTSGIDQIIFGRRLTSDDVERVERAASGNPDVVLAILLSDREEPEVKEFGSRWKLSSASMQSILGLRRLAKQLQRDPGSVLIALYDFGSEASKRGVAYLQGIGEQQGSELLQRMLREHGERIFALQPLLGGEEICELAGIPPGPELGRLKREMVEAQIRGDLVTREDAERWVVRPNTRL